MDNPKMTFSGWRGPKEPVRVVIPEGMLQVGRAAYNAYVTADRGAIFILEAALRWLSENPVVPTPEQTKKLLATVQFGAGREIDPHLIENLLLAWQRRMFLAPEPEVPEAIKDLLYAGNGLTSGDIDKKVIEAYRRGQKAACPTCGNTLGCVSCFDEAKTPTAEKAAQR